MKSFLEEYGFAILAAIVVILLIAMATPVGNLIKNQILGVIDSFANRTEAKLSAIDDSEVELTLKSVAGSAQVEGSVNAPSATDKFKVEYKVNKDGAWTVLKGGEPLTEVEVAYNGLFTIAKATSGAKDKDTVYVRLTDLGTGEIVAEKQVEYKD